MVDTSTVRRSPRLVGWAPGRIDVAWMAADPLPLAERLDSTGRSREPPFTRIERASFDGRSWSLPEVVVSGAVRDMPYPAVGLPGTPFDESVFAIATRDSAGELVRVGYRRDGRWVTTTWRDPSFYFYGYPVAFRARDGGITLLVRVSSHDPADRTTVRSMQLVERRGDSPSWSAPVIVGPSGSGQPMPHVARLGADSLLVGWHMSSANGIVTALTVDGGRSWSLQEPMRGGSVDGAVFVVDGRGTVHVIYRASSDPGVLNSSGGIMMASWRAGAWSAPVVVSSEQSFTAPSAGTTTDGSVMILWTAGQIEATGVSPRSRARIWSPACR